MDKTVYVSLFGYNYYPLSSYVCYNDHFFTVCVSLFSFNYH